MSWVTSKAGTHEISPLLRGEPPYANDEYVCVSVCLPTVSLQRSNIFEIRFRHSTYGVICNLKFVL
jgi:hypothetical protein